VVAVLSVWLFFWGHRQPIDTRQPTPRVVRLSFLLFAVVLVMTGGALILRTPNILPWPPRVETGSLIGIIFFSDAFYFLYGLLRPYWPYARTQLWSFLAYDLVLIGPLAAFLPSVQPNLQVNLIVYLAVLIYRGALAVYYLLINKATRITA
jgi:hypothetical protein